MEARGLAGGQNRRGQGVDKEGLLRSWPVISRESEPIFKRDATLNEASQEIS